ncbi:MAG: hypothetical protein SH850_21680 [Planctomycetaceae bacterium]|nr:hypothetical protein [Planctomycetaceae bacterium]
MSAQPTGASPMRLQPRPPMSLILKYALVFLFATSVSVGAQTDPAKPTDPPPEATLPKYKDLQPPTADEILKGKPVDWIVLLNGDVILTDPVHRRPGTLEKIKAEHDAVSKQAVSAKDLPEKLKKLAELERLKITLFDSTDDPEFTLEIRFIERIVHFEDLIVRRISKTLDERQLPTAYELLMFLDRRARGWDGFDAVYQRFLFLDATRLARDARWEAALMQTELLFDVDHTYPERSSLHGRIIDALIKQAIFDDDYRQARHFLARLERFLARLESREPAHAVVETWTTELKRISDDVITQARAAQTSGKPRDASLTIDRAARVWPNLPRLKEAHKELIDAHQILNLGVLRLPNERPSRITPSPADERHRQLTEIALFEPDQLKDDIVRFRSAFIESWDPQNLGRDITFRMKPRRATWESRPVLTSGAIAEALSRRVDPLDPTFDERWAADVLSVESSSPWDWQLRLERIPLRIESRLRFPVPLSAAEREWSPDLAADSASSPRQQRFYVTDRTDRTVVWQRTRPQLSSAQPRLLAEVIEHRYDNWERLLQGLQRGEIDGTPVAEWKDLPALQADSRFFVLPYALPRTHVLLVAPQSVLATNGTLRRALLHALPREKILLSEVLQLPPSIGADTRPPPGRVVTSPFATTSYGHHPQLVSPEFNPILAASLIATAKQQLGGKIPPLTLLVPDDPVVERALPAMIAAWKYVGVDVAPVTATGDDAVQYDLVYRVLQSTEPITDLWPLLSPTGQTDLASIEFLPHWLRDRILELDRAVDWTTAVRLLHRIETEFLLEARWLPLWEVDESLVLRKRMGGLPQSPRLPMHTYHDIEHWALQSWYPTDTP